MTHAKWTNMNSCVAALLPLWSVPTTKNCHLRLLWKTKKRTHTTLRSCPLTPATSTTRPSFLPWVRKAQLKAVYVDMRKESYRPNFSTVHLKKRLECIWIFFCNKANSNYVLSCHLQTDGVKCTSTQTQTVTCRVGYPALKKAQEVSARGKKS